MNARPICPFTVAEYRATVLRFLAHRSLPVASRYYQTMVRVSIPAEKLIKPTQVSKVPSILDI